jgi:hypothetical protein
MPPSDFSPSVASDFTVTGLYISLRHVRTWRPGEISLVSPMTVPAFHSPYAGEFFEAARPESSPLPWPSRRLMRWALSCSPCGANMTTLQDSLYGTDYRVAPPFGSHSASPPSVTAGSGSLLRGSLAITATGLSPASHRTHETGQVSSRHTKRKLGGDEMPTISQPLISARSPSESVTFPPPPP